MTEQQLQLTARHEAGHVVAAIRLGIEIGPCSIVPTDVAFGTAIHDGDEWDATGAEAQALVACAGYAALVAAEVPHHVAEEGCTRDFERAIEMAAGWELDAGLNGCKARSVGLMSRPENVAAVALVASQLLEHQTLDADYVTVLVEVADGETTPDEFERYLRHRQIELGIAPSGRPLAPQQS